MSGIFLFEIDGILQDKTREFAKNISKYYSFESADILCKQFNKFRNTLKKEKEETKDKYPLLD